MQSFTISLDRWCIARSFMRNPLVRLSDRIEAAILIAVVSILLVAVPLVAAVGTVAHESSSRSLVAPLPTAHKVTATAIKGNGHTFFRTGPSAALARWQTSDGQHTGYAMWDRPSVRVGDQMEIWVDAGGQRVAPPMWPAVHAFAIDVGSWMSCAAVCIAGFALVRLRLNYIQRAGSERELNSLARDNGRGRAHP